MKTSRLLLFTSLFTANAIADASLTKPIASPDLVFKEKAGEGMPADPGYPGIADNFDNPSVDDTRKFALWGNAHGRRQRRGILLRIQTPAE